MKTSEPLIIEIATPCHANWETMTPSEQGRTCGLCTKEVVDLNGKSDEEVMAIFSSATDELCTRIETKRTVQPRYHFPKWNFARKFAFVLFVVFGAQLFAAEDVAAREVHAELQYITAQESNAPASKLVVTGFVHAEGETEGLELANILLVIDSTIVSQTTSDLEGNFQINLPATLADRKEEVKLVIQFIGYAEYELTELSFDAAGWCFADVTMSEEALTLSDGSVPVVAAMGTPTSNVRPPTIIRMGISAVSYPSIIRTIEPSPNTERVEYTIFTDDDDY